MRVRESIPLRALYGRSEMSGTDAIEPSAHRLATV
jgi:hypothetical protein